MVLHGFKVMNHAASRQRHQVTEIWKEMIDSIQFAGMLASIVTLNGCHMDPSSECTG